jgi:hypothetical protein
MSDLDKLIEDTLREADQGAPGGNEPGYFKQAKALFSGRLAWVHWTIMVAQLGFFIGGTWCAVNFFNAQDTLEAVRWGLPGAVLLVYAAIFKSSLGPQMETNRLIMEIKRLELRLVQAEARRTEAG